MLAARIANPVAANSMLKALRGLMAYAVRAGIRADNPIDGVRPIRLRDVDGKARGFKNWSEDEIARFESVHRSARWRGLALELALGTGRVRKRCHSGPPSRGRRRPAPRDDFH
jgi:hypothetical protein